MAILGPSELPYVLKVDSEPIKKYVLSKLGLSSVEVEVSEDQWETVLKTTGNFIAHYLSKEQRFAVFYSTPLVSTYPLPNDAYWVQEVAWDPVSTNIGDVFGAESFLFCFADGMMVLRDDGVLVDLAEWKPEFKAKTPYGPRKLILERHEQDQELVEVVYEGGLLKCTPNHPIKINGIDDMINDWVEAKAVTGEAIGVGCKNKILNVKAAGFGPTTTIYVVGAHCFYGCHGGQPILVH